MFLLYVCIVYFVIWLCYNRLEFLMSSKGLKNSQCHLRTNVPKWRSIVTPSKMSMVELEPNPCVMRFQIPKKVINNVYRQQMIFGDVWRSNSQDVRKLVEVDLGCHSVLQSCFGGWFGGEIPYRGFLCVSSYIKGQTV